MTITFTKQELERLINAMEYTFQGFDMDMSLSPEEREETNKLGELLERIKEVAKNE